MCMQINYSRFQNCRLLITCASSHACRWCRQMLNKLQIYLLKRNTSQFIILTSLMGTLFWLIWNVELNVYFLEVVRGGDSRVVSISDFECSWPGFQSQWGQRNLVMELVNIYHALSWSFVEIMRLCVVSVCIN